MYFMIVEMCTLSNEIMITVFERRKIIAYVALSYHAIPAKWPMEGILNKSNQRKTYTVAIDSY